MRVQEVRVPSNCTFGGDKPAEARAPGLAVGLTLFASLESCRVSILMTDRVSRWDRCMSEGQELPPIPSDFEQFTPRTARALVRGGYRALSRCRARGNWENP